MSTIRGREEGRVIVSECAAAQFYLIYPQRLKGPILSYFTPSIRRPARPFSHLFSSLLLSYLCKLPRWNFLKKQNWKAGNAEGDDEGGSQATAEAASAASPVQLLSPAAPPRRRLFQFQDGEEQGDIS